MKALQLPQNRTPGVETSNENLQSFPTRVPFFKVSVLIKLGRGEELIECL
jgi:hypothetical protein